MSTSRTRSITCRCGGGFDAEVFESVNVVGRPDLRDQILGGHFHRFTCASCGEPVFVESRVAYFDLSRRHWFTVFPRIDLRHRDEMVAFARSAFQDTLVERAPEMVRKWGTEMTQRAIFGLASLREKLIVLEAGLDDRLAEHLKLQLFTTGELVFHPDTFLHATQIERDQIVMDYAP